MSDFRFRNRARRPALVAALLATTMFGGGAVVGHAWSATNPASPPISVEPSVKQVGLAEVVTKVKPAVVNISSREMVAQADEPDMPGTKDLPPGFQQFFQHKSTKQPGHALGSGFIVDAAGYIVTNNHVVDGASEITVTTNDGDSYKAKVVGRDAKTDLALLKIDAGKSLPYVAFGDSEKAQVGDWVVAVGNPFGLGGTVTAGPIPGPGPDNQKGPHDNILHIDAPPKTRKFPGPPFHTSPPGSRTAPPSTPPP